jgi:hypothetical protein
MRKTATKNGVSVSAYAGTTGVLLGMNIDPEGRDGLLGFALERLDGASGEKEWLNGIVSFSDTDHEAGDPIPTNIAPVQRFRWSDYRVYPDTEYTYSVHPVYGSPAEPEVSEGPTVAVRTADLGGEHACSSTARRRRARLSLEDFRESRRRSRPRGRRSASPHRCPKRHSRG